MRPNHDGKVSQLPSVPGLSSVMSTEAIVSGGILSLVAFLRDSAEVSRKTLVSKTREVPIQLQTWVTFPLR